MNCWVSSAAAKLMQPLPMMILDLSINELRAFRSELSNRLRQMALP